jgi:hypothetical protein
VTIVTDLDLPVFDCTASDLAVDVCHQRLASAAQAWLAGTLPAGARGAGSRGRRILPSLDIGNASWTHACRSRLRGGRAELHRPVPEEASSRIAQGKIAPQRGTA